MKEMNIKNSDRFVSWLVGFLRHFSQYQWLSAPLWSFSWTSIEIEGVLGSVILVGAKVHFLQEFFWKILFVLTQISIQLFENSIQTSSKQLRRSSVTLKTTLIIYMHYNFKEEAIKALVCSFKIIIFRFKTKDKIYFSSELPLGGYSAAVLNAWSRYKSKAYKKKCTNVRVCIVC